MSATVADNNNNNNDNICANCGKGEESSVSLKACTACKLVKYCNRECQIAHRSQHKKQCKKRAAELHDEKLFKQPPLQYGDCPICFLRLPTLRTASTYKPCCGKLICSGCAYAPVYDNQGNEVTEKTCPFCRAPISKSDEEENERIKRRAEAGNAEAIFTLGHFYADGEYGFPQDYDKALELWHRAGDLGCAAANYNIGIVYDNGEGVNVDQKKAKHYYELAAMGGHVDARHNLGIDEENADNIDRALKHLMIAVRGGGNDSLKTIREMVTIGHATKDDFKKALESYQAYLDEIRSDQRDKAAAEVDEYKYY